jgi:hypothetical protein
MGDGSFLKGLVIVFVPNIATLKPTPPLLKELQWDGHFPTRNKINISMLVMQMKKSSWMDNLGGGGAKGVSIEVGTIERLEVTKDQVKLEKEDANVEEVTKYQVEVDKENGNVEKVTKDQVGVEKGDADVVEATKVGFEVENERIEVAAPQEIDDAKEGGEATNVVHDGGLHKGRGVTMDSNSHTRLTLTLPCHGMHKPS